jgi:hypothetical protein
MLLNKSFPLLFPFRFVLLRHISFTLKKVYTNFFTIKKYYFDILKNCFFSKSIFPLMFNTCHLGWLNFIYFSVAIVAYWIISMLRFLEKRSPCWVDILENKTISIYLSTEKIDLNKISVVRLFIKWNYYFVHLIRYFWQCDYVKYYIEIVEFDLKSIAPILDFNLIWISSFFSTLLETCSYRSCYYCFTFEYPFAGMAYPILWTVRTCLNKFHSLFFSKDDSRPLIRNDRSIDH